MTLRSCNYCSHVPPPPFLFSLCSQTPQGLPLMAGLFQEEPAFPAPLHTLAGCPGSRSQLPLSFHQPHPRPHSRLRLRCSPGFPEPLIPWWVGYFLMFGLFNSVLYLPVSKPQTCWTRRMALLGKGGNGVSVAGEQSHFCVDHRRMCEDLIFYNCFKCAN